MKTIFKVVGPLKLHYTNYPGGKIITENTVAKFWTEHSKCQSLRGCYVFCMRAGKGVTPWYVGKTGRSFKKEIFTPHKLHYYSLAMVKYKRGKPVLFFVTAAKTIGKPNNSRIREVEKYLINLATSRNDDLLNQQDRTVPKWGIRGVVRGGKGKVAKGAQTFRTMIGLS